METYQIVLWVLFVLALSGISYYVYSDYIEKSKAVKSVSSAESSASSSGSEPDCGGPKAECARCNNTDTTAYNLSGRAVTSSYCRDGETQTGIVDIENELYLPGSAQTYSIGPEVLDRRFLNVQM